MQRVVDIADDDAQELQTNKRCVVGLCQELDDVGCVSTIISNDPVPAIQPPAPTLHILLSDLNHDLPKTKPLPYILLILNNTGFNSIKHFPAGILFTYMPTVKGLFIFIKTSKLTKFPYEAIRSKTRNEKEGKVAPEKVLYGFEKCRRSI